MMWGFSPVLSVFWATVVSFLTSFLRSDTAMISYDLFRGKGSFSQNFFQSPLIQALRAGSVGILSVGSTCAGHGILVGVDRNRVVWGKRVSVRVDHDGDLKHKKNK